MAEQEHEEKLKTKFALKKIVRQLSAIKGRHTELVTVYVPANYSLHEVLGQLRNEQSTADNIKSKPVRKNVTTALEKIMRHLQLFRKTPDNGLALFCGNVSPTEAKTEIELWSIEPPEPVKTKMYWCDQRFVLDPLEDMVAEREIYGLINLDKSEASVALLIGKKIETIFHKESIVPGKTRAGGQSSARFGRIREGLLNDWLKQVGEAANKIFTEHKEVLGIVLSGPGPIKEMFLKEDYMYADVKKKIIGTVDTSYTGPHGLEETLERGEDLLKELGVTKEKLLLQKFFNELQKPHGLVTYGFAEVLKALEIGAVDMVIVSESCELRVKEYVNNEGESKIIAWKPGVVIPSEYKMIGDMDIIEFFEERVKKFGSRLEVVSAETREGLQFAHFGGAGALLRYSI